METRLGTILKEKPQALFTVASDATVQEAVDIMSNSNVGCIMVMDHGRLMGLFTERDLMKRVIHAGLNPRQTAVHDVMTTEIATVTPALTVGEAMALCTDKRLRHLPVYDGDTLLGIVSAGDLTKWAISEQEHTIDDLTRYIYGERA
ncbi:CBS domain-containing protein [Aquisalimonas lutea]|uniref:CBS domain-containing protein n=1 Tax=Aquisalimonas lutea TaxID=1327750 RepID=UPI0025B2BBA4|nr:CBS domain-containing protein [Aquisalimonas lutea]MDN3518972.1 CBS domain-containing protein [Aquisalimonas lutea]